MRFASFTLFSERHSHAHRRTRVTTLTSLIHNPVHTRHTQCWAASGVELGVWRKFICALWLLACYTRVSGIFNKIRNRVALSGLPLSTRLHLTLLILMGTLRQRPPSVLREASLFSFSLWSPPTASRRPRTDTRSLRTPCTSKSGV